MKIADSAIQLYSKNTAIEQHQKRESLLLWQNDRNLKNIKVNNGRGRQVDANKELRNRLVDKVAFSTPGNVKRRHIKPAEVELGKDKEMIGELNMRILRALFERLTGRKFQIIDPAKITDPTSGENLSAAQGGEVASVEAPESEGYGLVYDYHESHYEYEKTEFAASGQINTADGQRIDFSVDLSMSREFYSEQNINIRAGDALKDPLVINFSGTAGQLTQRDFSFDIDADGTSDQVAFVAPGSGFLALDKNNDNLINDGSELFGTISGNGFSDLSAYDEDGNSWIDENDAIYESLRIWSKDSNGRDQLIALGTAGVGALYLGHIESLFSIKDQDNELLGQIRETGLAIMENGQVVTMQQIDLVA